MKMKTCCLLLLLLILGCRRKINDLNLNFPDVQKIIFHKVKLSDDDLLKPYDLLIVDSLTILRDPFNGKLLSIIDINRERLTNRVISIGRGPNEVIGANIFKMRGKQLQVVDVSVRKTQIHNLDSLLEGIETPAKSIIYDKFPIEKDEFLLSVQFLNEDNVIAIGAFADGRFRVYNIKSLKSYPVSEFPEDYSREHSIESNFTKLTAFQGLIQGKPDNTKFLYYSHMCYNFEILEFQVGRLTKVSEKSLNFPLYGRSSDGSAVFKRENKLSFAYSDVTNDFIYLLYIGRSLVDHSENYTYGNEIHVFDWDGNEKIKYLLNRDVKAISVDARNNKIYGLSINPESLTPELGYFEY